MPKSPVSKREAITLFERGRFRAAISAFAKFASRDKKDYVALFYLALSLYETGNLASSLRYWKRLKKLGPSQRNVHLNLGCVYHALNREDLAIRNYKRELQINAISGEALYNLGTLYYRRHQYKEAVLYLEKCYALKHSVKQIVDRLACSYFKTRQLEKEMALYYDWLREHPKDTWCLNNLGAALMHAAEYNRAQLILERAAKLDSSDEMVKRNLEKVRLIRKEMRPAGAERNL